MTSAINSESSQASVLITGAEGFVGKNLTSALSNSPSRIQIHRVGRTTSKIELEKGLAEASIIYHLAGANRPERVEEFQETNAGYTATLCEMLQKIDRKPKIIYASSTQATLDNPYGKSKLEAEQILRSHSTETGTPVRVLRLPNVFGKWAKPNYNSAVATFCHQIARGEEVTINDPAKPLSLLYIDDLIEHLVRYCEHSSLITGYDFDSVQPVHPTTVGSLAETIRSFPEIRRSALLPSLETPLVKKLYSTYLSYLPAEAFAYPLLQRSDERGVLAEFVKSATSGQIFVSRTHPGFTRGNHFHQTKTEKFFVVEGEGIVRFRKIEPTSNDERAPIIEHRVSGRDFKVVDIPPGYTHSIENVGSSEMITIFWANEIFDPERSDTYPSKV